MKKTNKDIHYLVLTLSEVASKIGTSDANIRGMIKREAIPHCYFRQAEWEENGKIKKGTYLFRIDFIEYYEKMLKKSSRN